MKIHKIEKIINTNSQPRRYKSEPAVSFCNVGTQEHQRQGAQLLDDLVAYICFVKAIHSAHTDSNFSSPRAQET